MVMAIHGGLVSSMPSWNPLPPCDPSSGQHDLSKLILVNEHGYRVKPFSWYDTAVFPSGTAGPVDRSRFPLCWEQLQAPTVGGKPNVNESFHQGRTRHKAHLPKY